MIIITIHPSPLNMGMAEFFPRAHHVYTSRAISTPISVATPDFCYRLLPGGRPALSGGRPTQPSLLYHLFGHDPST